ncbi:MAG: GNAT family N-acetyltransferase, partial [Syntrophobacteraceae bacterium]
SYKPLYFTGREGAEVSALIPVMEVRSFLTGKRGVSMPFTDRCEPIVTEGGRFSSVFDEILHYGKKAGWKYLELRGGAKHLDGPVPYRTYMRHVLKIHDQEKQLFTGLKKGTKSNVRKAAVSGVRVTISDSETDLDQYYRLHCLTRKRHGTPPQPYSFFKAIHRNVISKGKGFTVLGTWQDRPVSGAVYLHSGRKAIYKFGASDLRYQHLRPANLVMWEAIRWFSKNGFDELCFGRTDLDNAGLIHFKGGWGAREEPLDYYRYDLKRSIFVKGLPEMSGLAERIFRGLPVPLLRLAGELLYRHMG